MKNFIKAMLIVAGVFTAVGIGLSVGGVAMGATVEGVEVVQKMRSGVQNLKERFWTHRDWDDDDWDDDDDWNEDPSVTSDGGNRMYQTDVVKEIEVDLNYDEFTMEAYEGDTIRIEIENDSAQNVRVKSDSNSLKIESQKKKNNRYITVYYPKNAKFKKVEIDVKAGTVEFMDRLETEELEVNIGAGQFTNSDSIIAKKADFEVGAGEINVMQLTADKIDGDCGVGDIVLELTGKEKDYNYKLECGLGNISIEGEDFTSIAGEKKINNTGAQKDMKLECSMGTVEVAFTDGE